MQHSKKTRPVSKKRVLVGGAAGMLALTVGGGRAFAADMSSPSPMPTATSTAAAPGAVPSYATSLNLQAMPVGTVSFHNADGKLMAKISAFGLTPGSTHLAEITSPALEAPITFSQFTASPTGQVSTTISSLGPVHRLPSHAVFQIDLTTSPGQPIAKVNVGSVTAKTLRLVAVETSARQPLNGHASVSYNGKTQTLTVKVDASGFVPNTAHAAHVHTGSCQSQGAVVTMLQDLRANANGRIAQTDVVQNVASFTPSSGLYLNIHEGNSANILDAAGNPTPQFRPLLCANFPTKGSHVQKAHAVAKNTHNHHGGTGSPGKKSPARDGGNSGKETMPVPVPMQGNSGGSSQGSMPSQGAVPPANGAPGTNAAPGTSPTTLAPRSGSGSTTQSPNPGAGLPDPNQLLQEANSLGQQAETLAQSLTQGTQDPAAAQSQLTRLQSQEQTLQQQFQQETPALQADSQMFSMLSNAFSTATKSIGNAESTLAAKDPGSTSPGTDPTQSTAPPAAAPTTPPVSDAAPTPDPAPVVDVPPVDLGGLGDLGGGSGGGD